MMESVIENQLYSKKEKPEKLKSEVSSNLESETEQLDVNSKVLPPSDEVKLEPVKEEPGTAREGKEEVIVIEHSDSKK